MLPIRSSIFLTAVLAAVPALVAQRPDAPAARVTRVFPAGSPLADSLKLLTEQHGLSVVYGAPIGDQTVHASFRDVPALDVASSLLGVSGYRYRIAPGPVLVIEHAPVTPAAVPGAAPIPARASGAVDIAVAETIAATREAAEAESVKPGINESFLSEDLDVGSYVQRFEGESREVFVHRGRIAAAVGVEAGMAVADVGAGTGLYLDAFAKKVGDGGKLYAVDLAPKFIDHLKERVAAKGYDQVEVVQCTEDSAELPPNSVDRVFICDTYHHFEFPRATMTSILRALRPGGELIVVDFDRIPGVSRDWLLGHVRAGRDEVCAELASFGFEFREFVPIPGLRENYVVRFAKPE